MMPMHEEELNEIEYVHGKKHYIGTSKFPCTGHNASMVHDALKEADKWTQSGYNLAIA